MDQHALALRRLVAGDTRANLGDLAAWLVATHKLAVGATRHAVRPQIAATHARRSDLDHHLARPGRWIGKLLERDLALAQEHQSPHRPQRLSGGAHRARFGRGVLEDVPLGMAERGKRERQRNQDGQDADRGVDERHVVRPLDQQRPREGADRHR